MITQAVITLLENAPTVTGRVSGRIWPRQMPDAPDFPCIVVTKIHGRGEHDMAGATPLEEARVQIDSYSMDGYADAVAIAKAVRDVLHGYTGPALSSCGIQRAVCINSMDLPEPLMERAGPRLRRRMLEFSIWSTET